MEVAANTGWTLGQAGDLTVDELGLLHQRWAEFPPAPVVLRAVAESLGVKFRKRSKPAQATEAGLKSMGYVMPEGE